MSQDWNTVVIRKPTAKGAGPSSEQLATRAVQSGIQIETTKKYGAGANQRPTTDLNTKKLDEETEELRHRTVSLDFSRKLQQARQAKGMTQKELATAINEPASTVNTYEAGKAIPNSQIISKMERVLGVKLRSSLAPRCFLPCFSFPLSCLLCLRRTHPYCQFHTPPSLHHLRT
eukprot:32418_6